MKRETTLAIAVGLAVILSACTTTKDLERRPQMVAVDSSGISEEGKRLGEAATEGRNRKQLHRGCEWSNGGAGTRS